MFQQQQQAAQSTIPAAAAAIATMPFIPQHHHPSPQAMEESEEEDSEEEDDVYIAESRSRLQESLAPPPQKELPLRSPQEILKQLSGKNNRGKRKRLRKRLKKQGCWNTTGGANDKAASTGNVRGVANVGDTVSFVNDNNKDKSAEMNMSKEQMNIVTNKKEREKHENNNHQSNEATTTKEVIDLVNSDDDNDDNENRSSWEVIDLVESSSNNDDDESIGGLYQIEEETFTLQAMRKRTSVMAELASAHVDETTANETANDGVADGDTHKRETVDGSSSVEVPLAASKSIASNNVRMTSAELKEALEQTKQDLKRAQQLTTTAHRKEVLQPIKARLKELQLKFQSMRQQETTTLPPIAALRYQDNLILSNISGPDELVRYHKDNEDTFETIRLQAIEMASPTSRKKKSQRLQENIQVLKRKLSQLKTKESLHKKLRSDKNEVNDGLLPALDGAETLVDEASSLPATEQADTMAESTEGNDTENVENAANDETSSQSRNARQSKEDLMKRQGELQAQMDIGYWKKLVAKQKKLLEEQEQKVQGIEKELRECEKGIGQESKGLQECNDAIARWPILDEMIVNTTLQVLKTRKALRQAREGGQEGAQEADPDKECKL